LKAVSKSAVNSLIGVRGENTAASAFGARRALGSHAVGTIYFVRSTAQSCIAFTAKVGALPRLTTYGLPFSLATPVQSGPKSQRPYHVCVVTWLHIHRFTAIYHWPKIMLKIILVNDMLRQQKIADKW